MSSTDETRPDDDEDVDARPCYPDVANIPAESLAHVKRFFEAPLEEERELKRQVSLYLEKVQREHVVNDYLNLRLAEQVADALTALLEVAPDLPEEHRRLVHAGAYYFMSQDDAVDDFATLTGFGDDADVVAAVAAHIGRTDLMPEDSDL